MSTLPSAGPPRPNGDGRKSSTAAVTVTTPIPKRYKSRRLSTRDTVLRYARKSGASAP